MKANHQNNPTFSKPSEAIEHPAVREYNGYHLVGQDKIDKANILALGAGLLRQVDPVTGETKVATSYFAPSLTVLDEIKGKETGQAIDYRLDLDRAQVSKIAARRILSRELEDRGRVPELIRCIEESEPEQLRALNLQHVDPERVFASAI